MSDPHSEDTLSTVSSENTELKMTKPPDKKRYEAQLAKLVQNIEAKQTEMRALTPKADEATMEKLRTLRAEKESTIARRRKVDSDLNALNQEIRTKNNEVTKVQSNLQGYRNESKINDAIQRLETQLKMNNYKLSEEKKIVSEIDRLKRSKHVLAVVTSLKQEIDSMRDSQRRMRTDRDMYFKKVTEIKQKEDAIRHKVQADRVRHDELKKELDALYEEKRELTSQYKAQEKEYLKYRDGVRHKQRQEEQMKKIEERIQYQQELAEYEASREPNEREKQLCNTLITYLEKCMPITTQPDMTSQENDESERGSSGHDSDTLAQSLESEGFYLLKKKPEDLFRGVTKPKTQRRSKKDKKRIVSNKPLQHSPQTLNQFAELGVKAPTTVQEIPETLTVVNSKKLYYERLQPLLGGPSVDMDGCLSDGCSAGGGAPSVTESAIAESIPSTPEVMTDNSNPFLHEGTPSGWRPQRKLSHDSGAWELEDYSDEQKTPECSQTALFTQQHPLTDALCGSTRDKVLEDMPSKMAEAAAAGGDFVLSRRTLSTVSNSSDKESSASSDTIVDSPHNKSCDDLKLSVPSIIGAPSVQSDVPNPPRDLLLGNDWPVLSRVNSVSSPLSPRYETKTSNSDDIPELSSKMSDLLLSPSYISPEGFANSGKSQTESISPDLQTEASSKLDDIKQTESFMANLDSNDKNSPHVAPSSVTDDQCFQPNAALGLSQEIVPTETVETVDS